MKTITRFDLNTNNIPAGGERRYFSVIGDNFAVFSLEIKNEDSHYYNFSTQAFQTAKTGLKDVSIRSGVYRGYVVFPPVGDNDHYDIYLWAGLHHNTKHNKYVEVRFADDSIDINSSSGSDSALMTKVIYQYTDTTVTITAAAPTLSDSGEIWNGVSITNDTIVTSRTENFIRSEFSVVVTAGSGHAIAIARNPTSSDVFYTENRVIGSPSQIEGEDIYPAVSDTDTVDGAVTSGILVVMDNNVADNIVVGDRITGNADLNDRVVTVAALNPNGDDVKEFSMSEAISISDGITLSFSNRKNYRWGINSSSSIHNLSPSIVPLGTNITAGSTIAPYEQTVEVTTTVEGEADIEYGSEEASGGTTDEVIDVVKVKVEALDTLGHKPTITNGLVTKQLGNVTFSKQQALLLDGDTVAFYAYGETGINTFSGAKVSFSDLKVTLTDVTTTVSDASATGSAALSDFDVASVAGIMDDVSVVSGVNIKASDVNPTVTTISSSNLTVSPTGHLLQNGQTLTFKGASTIATITGTVEISRLVSSTISLGFDVERFLIAV